MDGMDRVGWMDAQGPHRRRGEKREKRVKKRRGFEPFELTGGEERHVEA
jgi:hypothetical protein